MNRKIMFLIGLLFLWMITGCLNHKLEINETKGEVEEMEKTSDDFSYSIKVIINDKIYKAELYGNETSKILMDLLPRTFHMSELNGNEKYVYLDNRLPVNSEIPKYITKGDIMLYENNCLVIFYQSFVSSYHYTKIGHIENLEDLGQGEIEVRFEK